MSARVAIVGGGITGLSAARRLAADAHGVVVFEPSEEFGGKIRATPFGGLASVDSGPDAVLARVPWGVDLLHDLGFGDPDLGSPETGTAFVSHAGALHQIPHGLVLGVPAGMSGLIRSRLLSWRGKARAGLDVILPTRSIDHDSLGQLIRDRFGAEVLERLVDPLVGSINAGDSDHLSLVASTPQIAPVAAKNRSLLLGLRAVQTTSTATGPVFVTPRAGLAVMVERLVRQLTGAGADLRSGVTATGVDPDGVGYRINDEAFDGVVLAAPAYATAGLLRTIAPEAAHTMTTVRYAGVVMVTIRIDDARFLARLPEGSGFLVPKPDQLHLTAASFASRKWAHWQPPAGGEIFRLSLGRYGNEAPLELDDDTCVTIALKELAQHCGFAGDLAAAEARVTRWPDAFPQYEPHHLSRVAEIEGSLSVDAPRIVAAGAAYRGIGIPACIRQGTEAAALLSTRLG